MKLPLEIVFRNLEPSEAIEARVRERAEKLEKFYHDIMSCRVVVEAHHKHHHKGNLYHVRIDLTVPDAELIASREPHQHHAHEDVYVAIRGGTYTQDTNTAQTVHPGTDLRKVNICPITGTAKRHIDGCDKCSFVTVGLVV